MSDDVNVETAPAQDNTASDAPVETPVDSTPVESEPQTPVWSIPDALKDNPLFAGVTSDEEMYARIGEASAKIPEVPEDLTAYEVPAPEGMEVDASIADGFRTIAKEHGLTVAQAKAMVEFHNSTLKDSMPMLEKAFQAKFQADEAKASIERDKELRKEWGKEYDGNVKKASILVSRLVGEDGAKALNKLALKDTSIVKALFGLANSIPEEALVRGEMGIGRKTMLDGNVPNLNY